MCCSRLWKGISQKGCAEKTFQQWQILTDVDEIISKRNPSPEDLEFGASQSEKFCAVYPINFPTESITRKMHVLSFVIPRHIRSGSAYRYLKIEQKGENLHCELNKLERELLSIKNVPSRYLMMIKKVENKLKATTKCQELSE